MEFQFFGETHNSYGSGPVLWIGALLDVEGRTFGSALDTIELRVFYPGVSKQAHASIPYDAPDKNTRRFERKRKTLRILWTSERKTEAQVGLRYLKDMTSELLLGAFDDTMDALRFGLARLTPADDFDREGLLARLAEMRARPWGDAEALQQTLKAASEKQRAMWAAQAEADPWSVLDVDWLKMAPNAREILDEPGDWSESNDFAPHGNDTGADVCPKTWRERVRLMTGHTGRHTQRNCSATFGFLKPIVHNVLPSQAARWIVVLLFFYPVLPFA